MNAQRLFFVFRRRGICNDNLGQDVSANHTPRLKLVTAPRRRKTKRRETIYIPPYKQSTPYGVWDASRKL